MTNPPRLIHARESLRPSSVDCWTRKETDEIVASLRPDAAAPRLVATDGPVMDGNTRIYILRDRGYDVDTLPRKLYEP
jgi:hypothetical protein